MIEVKHLFEPFVFSVCSCLLVVGGRGRRVPKAPAFKGPLCPPPQQCCLLQRTNRAEHAQARGAKGSTGV
jgi:hypothetical protein